MEKAIGNGSLTKAGIGGKGTPWLFLPLFPRNEASRRGGGRRDRSMGGGRKWGGGRGEETSHRPDDSMSADLLLQSGGSDVAARELSQSSSTAHIWRMKRVIASN